MFRCFFADCFPFGSMIRLSRSPLFILAFLLCCMHGHGFAGASEKVFTERMDPHADKNLIRSPYGFGDYLQYSKHIDAKQIKTIFEVGSRDAIDALYLGYHYKCPVYAFECNPAALEICNHNAKAYPYVTIVPYACWNEAKSLSFYPVMQSLGGACPVNIGGSSLLVARKDGCDKDHTQGAPIVVQAIRLDNWMKEAKIDQVDLLCLDVQGVTLQVLQGMGESLNKVKYIISEVYISPSFEGEALYPEVKAYLLSKGFYVPEEPTDPLFCDVLFINRNLASPS